MDEQRVVGGSEPALAEVEVHARERFRLPGGSEQGQSRRAGERGEGSSTGDRKLEQAPVFSLSPSCTGTISVSGEVFKAIYSSLRPETAKQANATAR